MTRTFQRFLRSFDDDELVSFVLARAAVNPPYWRALHLALRIEADRRGIRLEDTVVDAAVPRGDERTTRETA